MVSHHELLRESSEQQQTATVTLMHEQSTPQEISLQAMQDTVHPGLCKSKHQQKQNDNTSH